ncbi:MAG TPA: STAS domain-containing protein [Candidatus Methanoperedens sp.]|nr:STAS domain-containing protein [Candidatus Methanoperedens sp.]
MASFTFTTHVGGGRAIVRTRGYLSRVAGEQLEREIVRLLDAGERRFVVNLKETDLINSVGISILIGVIERVRGLGGELVFSELTAVNEEIFRIMGLHRHARLVRGDDEAGE